MSSLNINFGSANNNISRLNKSADKVFRSGARKPEPLSLTTAPGAVLFYEEEFEMCKVMDSLGTLALKDSKDLSDAMSDYKTTDNNLSVKWKKGE